MNSPLTGRRALVTGASGGIGGAIVLTLARAGVEVVLCYSGHRDDAEAVGRAIRELGGRAPVVRSDPSTPHAGQELVARASPTWARSTCWSPTPGSAGRPPGSRWTTTCGMRRSRSTSPRVGSSPGPQLLAWSSWGHLPVRSIGGGFGRILYVSSIAAITGGVIGPHYAASKAALHGLMHHMATRLAPSGVTVNVIAPALIAGTRILPPGAARSAPDSDAGGAPGSDGGRGAMALAMLTNPYLTNKVITLDGGSHPS